MGGAAASLPRRSVRRRAQTAAMPQPEGSGCGRSVSPLLQRPSTRMRCSAVVFASMPTRDGQR